MGFGARGRLDPDSLRALVTGIEALCRVLEADAPTELSGTSPDGGFTPSCTMTRGWPHGAGTGWRRGPDSGEEVVPSVGPKRAKVGVVQVLSRGGGGQRNFSLRTTTVPSCRTSSRR